MAKRKRTSPEVEIEENTQLQDAEKKTEEITEYYLQYLDYIPVSIETPYARGLDQNLPIKTVSHLIEAYQARPGSFLASIDSGLITIHPPKDVNKYFN